MGGQGSYVKYSQTVIFLKWPEGYYRLPSAESKRNLPNPYIIAIIFIKKDNKTEAYD